MDAFSIRYNSSLSADRAQACAGDSHVSSGIDVACTTTQSVFTIASLHELYGSSSLSSSTGTRSFFCNQQYSVTAITTSAGAISERYAYTAYGQPTILDASASVLSASAISNRYSYTGREWDATLALHHFRARWMSPIAGRFLGRDPIGYEGSEWGVYEYLSSSPLDDLDPSGLWWYRDPDGPEWHHNYPKGDPRLTPFWTSLGIQPNDAACGCLLAGKDHAAIHPHYQNELYRRIMEWVNGPPPRNLTKEKLDTIIAEVQNLDKFKKHFANSRPACCSYDKWRGLGTDGKRSIWNLGENAEVIRKMRERLTANGSPRAGQASAKLVAAMAFMNAAAGVMACASGNCDGELEELLAEARRIAPSGGLSPHGLSACIGYFSAFNKLASCMGHDGNLLTHSSIGIICSEVFGGR
jgi:RHS repeat-associated protein